MAGDLVSLVKWSREWQSRKLNCANGVRMTMAIGLLAAKISLFLPTEHQRKMICGFAATVEKA